MVFGGTGHSLGVRKQGDLSKQLAGSPPVLGSVRFGSAFEGLHWGECFCSSLLQCCLSCLRKIGLVLNTPGSLPNMIKTSWLFFSHLVDLAPFLLRKNTSKVVAPSSIEKTRSAATLSILGGHVWSQRPECHKQPLEGSEGDYPEVN